MRITDYFKGMERDISSKIKLRRVHMNETYERGRSHFLNRVRTEGVSCNNKIKI